MSLHKEPTNRAEQFALHLEQKYGLQLDLPRTNALVAELQEFANPTNPLANPRDPFSAVVPADAIVVPIDTGAGYAGYTAPYPSNPLPSFPTDAFVKPADSPALAQAVAYPADPFAKRTDAPYPESPEFLRPTDSRLGVRMNADGTPVNIAPEPIPEPLSLVDPLGKATAAPISDAAKATRDNDFLTRLRTGEPGDAA